MKRCMTVNMEALNTVQTNSYTHEQKAPITLCQETSKKWKSCAKLNKDGKKNYE